MTFTRSNIFLSFKNNKNNNINYKIILIFFNSLPKIFHFFNGECIKSGHGSV